MAKKRMNATQVAYNKERRRIERFLRSAEKRGYNFPENILPSVPKNITQGSVNRLVGLTSDKLYSKATATVKTYDKNGQAVYTTISGTERRRQERSEASKRASETRRQNARSKSTVPDDLQNFTSDVKQRIVRQNTEMSAEEQRAYERVKENENYQNYLSDEIAQAFGYSTADAMLRSSEGRKKAGDFVSARIKQDYLKSVEESERRIAEAEAQGLNSFSPPQLDEDFAKVRAEQDAYDLQHASEVQEGTIILNNLHDRINEFSGKGRDYLNNLLSVELHLYGEESVAQVLHDLEEEDPQIMEKMENLMYYNEFGNENSAHTAFKAIADAIKSKANGDKTYSMRIGNILMAMEDYSSAK